MIMRLGIFVFILLVFLSTITDCFFVHPKQRSFSCRHFTPSTDDTSEASHLIELRSISTLAVRELYPQLVAWKQEHGHPNIPLGVDGGRECQMIRELHTQQKNLTKVEVELLEQLGFEFHNCEEQLYWNNDFDDMLWRLSVNDNTFDPELEAWISGIRKLGKDRIRPEHALLLAYNNFSWEEEKKDESSFMTRYREIRENAKLYGRAFLHDPEIQQWIHKQEALKKEGLLSDSQYNYVLKLIGSKIDKLAP
eukprot:CAMPEP_0194223300 /NCGR_PEP_ID=MMETSP0156-20130528/34791_1 /TAXON_ID=33649 /ORGANISM="Thalassionema nitzschioides, Strain L26-B" /LENGTH=250 /DNA_ID=CAMNT_0038954379 /DNA_START=40 /DNA_END=792 /DNA_ORIENTATION=+